MFFSYAVADAGGSELITAPGVQGIAQEFGLNCEHLDEGKELPKGSRENSRDLQVLPSTGEDWNLGRNPFRSARLHMVLKYEE